MLATVEPQAIRLPLVSCGYQAELLKENFRFGEGRSTPLVAFAQAPTDSRSSCIAVTKGDLDSRLAVSDCKLLGAPIVLVCSGSTVQWWKQGTHSPEFLESIPAENIEAFFEVRKAEFAPDAVYRAKTWGRFKSEYQLGFVDLGLLPLVEAEVGSSLESLIERNVAFLKRDLKLDEISAETGHWLLQNIFWLLSGKILKDKQVDGFADLEVGNVEEVFRRLAAHYGTSSLPVHSGEQREGLRRAAETISQFGSLALTTTESLAYVYENALISKETRTQLGTHSTPSFLVDYVVGNLSDWISEIPASDRSVFEPACGHAAFLVSAMRLLTELLPPGQAVPKKRGPYLRSRLHGSDIDPFALELARLSLTLTDIPNPNGWDLKAGDMFRPLSLEEQSSQSTILLANPPFDNFSIDEQRGYSAKGNNLRFVNKATEMLWRTLPHLRAGSVFGVVLPQSFLHSGNSRDLREFLLRSFELREICLFPDQVFSFSDAESVVLLGRRREGAQSSIVRYRRIRERGLPQFRACYQAATTSAVSQASFENSSNRSLRLPDLAEVWQALSEHATLADHASTGQGFQYHGAELPEGQTTFSASHFPGAERGFIHFGAGVQLHELPKLYWLNLNESVVRRPVSGTLIGREQVLLNYAPSSRGPWRLKALLDFDGRAVSSRFIAVRPKKDACSVTALWALLNSPVANAYAFSHLGKRDNTVGDMRRLPMPALKADLSQVEAAAKRYLLAAARQGEALHLKELLLDVDCEVLRLYQLPVRLERSLLDVFASWERLGVPFLQDSYFPDEFKADASLEAFRYMESDWETTNRERARLIELMVAEKLEPAETIRLRLLQEYAEYHVFKMAPRPSRELEDLENQLLSLENLGGLNSR